MFNNQVRQRVRGLVAGIGPSIITNPDLLESKLADLATDNAEDVRLIVSAAKAGIPEEIATAPQEHRAEMVQQAATWMASETGVSPEAAQWAVETWTGALQSVKIAPAAQPAAAPQPTVLTPPPLAPSVPAYGADAPPAPWDTPRAPQQQSPWGAPPSSPSGPWQGQGYGGPQAGALPGPPVGYSQRRIYSQTINASSILTMGILGFFILGPILGPMAWMQGNKALAAIRDGYADPSQAGMVSAGRICGMIVTILSIAGLVVAIILYGTILAAMLRMGHAAPPAGG